MKNLTPSILSIMLHKYSINNRLCLLVVDTINYYNFRNLWKKISILKEYNK